MKEHGITEDQFQLNAIACNGIERMPNAALLRASKNVLPDNFIEGMACENGCIGGAGCITHGAKEPGRCGQIRPAKPWKRPSAIPSRS